jgi:signal transduction histidine kinase
MPAISRGAVPVLATALLALVAVGDYVTGVEITFTLLYLFPIAGAAWLHGRALGFTLAIAAAVCAIGVFLLTSTSRSVLPLAWNAGGELAIFLIVVWLVDSLRRHVERERDERRLAVEQLRHAERLGVIGTMAAGVAHELGTPLAVIAGSAEFLEDAQLSGERLREVGGKIRSQTQRMSAIIQHLLEFGRRGGGNRGAADLNAIARAAVELMSATARKQGVVIQLEPSPVPLGARVNASEIEQVLSNLLLNAVQASRGGTVAVCTGREERADTGGGAQVLGAISVEDHGHGIVAADLPRIFDPFFTTKGVGEGTGLGLSVSYGIVRDHGGAIEVDSVVGRGTRFTVLLPLDRAKLG